MRMHNLEGTFTPRCSPTHDVTSTLTSTCDPGVSTNRKIEGGDRLGKPEMVAVKVIDTGAIREDYVFKNLTREARLLSKLRHPNIVRLYETIQCGSVYYLVIELATGGDLSTHIKNQPLCRLDEKTAKGYGRQLVSALEHMHSRGIVHRDLKMENIMLQDPWKERIKIVDFGLSNMYTGESLLKTHCGSPEYAAPELFVVGKRYGPEVDLWSL
nr:hormonally up-regulated neu tumor-associated kinase homolog [Neodiprion pinetum]